MDFILFEKTGPRSIPTDPIEFAILDEETICALESYFLHTYTGDPVDTWETGYAGELLYGTRISLGLDRVLGAITQSHELEFIFPHGQTFKFMPVGIDYHAFIWVVNATEVYTLNSKQQIHRVFGKDQTVQLYPNLKPIRLYVGYDSTMVVEVKSETPGFNKYLWLMGKQALEMLLPSPGTLVVSSAKSMFYITDQRAYQILWGGTSLKLELYTVNPEPGNSEHDRDRQPFYFYAKGKVPKAYAGADGSLLLSFLEGKYAYSWLSATGNPSGTLGHDDPDYWESLDTFQAKLIDLPMPIVAS